LRNFWPRDEGGSDKGRRLRGMSRPVPRKQLFEMSLIPWQVLPQTMANLPMDRNPGSHLREVFQKLFVIFPLPPTRQDRQAAEVGPVTGQQPTDDGRVPDEMPHRFARYLLLSETTEATSGQGGVYFTLAAGSARDDLLRGRWTEASTKMVEARDQVTFQRHLAADTPDLGRQLAQWCDDAVAAQAAFNRAAANAGDQAALDTAKLRLATLWTGDPNLLTDNGKRGTYRLPVWLVALMGAASRPMGAEAIYLLALTKHELAVRTGEKKDWETANDWWKTFLEEHPGDPRTIAARELRAEALIALGDKAAALEMLRDLSGNLPNLQETGRLYRAKIISGQ